MGKSPYTRSNAVIIAQSKALKIELEKEACRPHQLRLVAPFDPATNTYQIYLSAEAQDKLAPDFAIGLSTRDGFVATGASFGVMSAPIVDGEAILSAAVPVYHADARIFTGPVTVESKLSEAQMINCLYTATFDIQSGSKKRIEGHTILPFRRVATTQHSGTTVNEQDGCEIEPLGATVTFSGADKSHLSINLKCPYKSLIAGDATRKNFIVITLDGAIMVDAVNKLFLD